MIDERRSRTADVPANDMPTDGPRSPLLLTAVIVWLIVLVSVVATQFIAK